MKVGSSSEYFVTQEEMGAGCCQKPYFKVIDLASNEVVYSITHDSCITAACCCGDVVYDVSAGGVNEGRLTKHWAGGNTAPLACFVECTNANTFVIDFPPRASPKEKAALVGAQLLIVSRQLDSKDIKYSKKCSSKFHLRTLRIINIRMMADIDK